MLDTRAHAVLVLRWFCDATRVAQLATDNGGLSSSSAYRYLHEGIDVLAAAAPGLHGGWPLWVSEVRPGREHDVTCARAHPGLFDALDA